MKVSEEFHEQDKEVTCHECGFIARGHFGKKGNWVSAYKVLAGHIMASRDHRHKRWAIKFLTGAEPPIVGDSWSGKGWLKSARGGW